MATITKTIGTTGRDYSTLALWEASIPANLVTDGNSYVGQCFNDTEFSGAGTMLTFAAHTTDSTHTLTLTTGSGQSFQDNANVRTNRLTYLQANGVAIKTTGNYSQTILMSGTVDYLNVSKLQITATSNSSAAFIHNAAANHSVIKDCILLGGGRCIKADGSSVKLINLLCVLTSSGTTSAVFMLDSVSVIGCTAVRPTAFTVGGTCYEAQAGGGNPSIVSSTSFGFTNTTGGSGSFNTGASSNNATDKASFIGSSNQTSVTYNSTSPFTAADPSNAYDFRAIAATSLISNGLLDSTNAPNDISNTARASSPTIGAWEVISTAVSRAFLLAVLGVG